MEFLAVLGGFLVPVILIVLIILILAANIKVSSSPRLCVERLGAFHSVWGVGIHFKIPFIEKVAKVVSLKEQVWILPPSPSSPRTTSPCRSTP